MSTATTPSPAPRSAALSRPGFLRRGQLNSAAAQKVYDRYLERVSRDLYSLSVSLQFVNTDASDAGEATVPAAPRQRTTLADRYTTPIDQLLQETREALLARKTELEALREAHEIQGYPAYDHPLQYDINVTSPRLGQFLGLIILLDQLLQAADSLWLYGLQHDKEHANEMTQWQRQVLRVAAEITYVGAQSQALAWFYRQGDEALLLKRLADQFRDEQLQWGTDGYLYRRLVALQFPEALAAIDSDPDSLVRAFAGNGWLEAGTGERYNRIAELAPGVRVVILNSTVSGHFLFTAGIGRRQRLRLASEHKSLLTELVEPKSFSGLVMPASDQAAGEVTLLRDKVA
ncbi:MAG: hypothetical protein U1F76_20945 [Candidatus Competibacteraceae bacterium]